MEHIHPSVCPPINVVRWLYTYIHNIRPDDGWIWTRKVSCGSHEDIAIAGHQSRHIRVWIEGTFTDALVVFDDCQIFHLQEKCGC